jgi:hypothetical protein
MTLLHNELDIEFCVGGRKIYSMTRPGAETEVQLCRVYRVSQAHLG